MVIRSTSNSLKTPGLEYVLTYFENPGVVLPQSITSWVAQKQLPDFLHKLYTATLEYAREKRITQEQQRQQKRQEEKLVRLSSSSFIALALIAWKMFKQQFYFVQCHNVYDLQDPGYEYPPEPEICFSKYKRNGNGNDDVENGEDDDDDFDDISSDSKSSNNGNDKKPESGAKFNTNTGTI